jgi:hypothetical protein
MIFVEGLVGSAVWYIPVLNVRHRSCRDEVFYWILLKAAVL